MYTLLDAYDIYGTDRAIGSSFIDGRVTGILSIPAAVAALHRDPVNSAAVCGRGRTVPTRRRTRTGTVANLTLAKRVGD